jgi:hypothetical protein
MYHEFQQFAIYSSRENIFQLKAMKILVMVAGPVDPIP